MYVLQTKYDSKNSIKIKEFACLDRFDIDMCEQQQKLQLATNMLKLRWRRGGKDYDTHT